MSADAAARIEEPRDLPRVAVAQLGARRHYAIPRILHGAGPCSECLPTVGAATDLELKTL